MTKKKDVFYGATDTGRVRGNNEDAFIAFYSADQKHVIAAVIDGPIHRDVLIDGLRCQCRGCIAQPEQCHRDRDSQSFQKIAPPFLVPFMVARHGEAYGMAVTEC